MKRLIYLFILLLAMAYITSCNGNQNAAETIVHEERAEYISYDSAEPETSDISHGNDSATYYFGSIENMYDSLINLNSNPTINGRFSMSIFIDDHDLENMPFGNMLTKLIAEKTLLFPYHQDAKMSHPNQENIPGVVVTESGACNLPWIDFMMNHGGKFFEISIMFYDVALINEANSKGASWLMSEIDPESTNVNNYETNNVKYNVIGRVVYETEVKIGDRDVLAMIFDNSARGIDSLVMYFVYDDVLVRMWGDRDTIKDTILPDLTFYEIYMPTNTALRDKPGRENSFNTKIIVSNANLSYNGVLTYDKIDFLATGSFPNTAYVVIEKYDNINPTPITASKIVDIAADGTATYSSIPTSVQFNTSEDYIRIAIYQDQTRQRLYSRNIIHPVFFDF